MAVRVMATNSETIAKAKINYNTHVKNIIIANCIACHDNPPSSGAPMPLTTYMEVKEAVLNRGLIERINSATNPMPPKGGPLPKEQRDIIEKWEEDGLLEK